MSTAENLTGQKFNRLTVLSRSAENSSAGKVQWLCKCECGTETLVVSQHLKNGNTKSCGCRRVEATRQNGLNRTTHGMTGTPEYKAWQNLRDRCYNEDAQQFRNYGGRGIRVCERWLNSFENFYADMGPRPSPEHSIDRRENNGDYEPSNCRWATPEEQGNNKRTNVYHELSGAFLTAPQIARQAELSTSTISSRLSRYGMTPDEAIDKGVGRHLYEVGGRTLNISELAKEFSIPYGTLYRRLITDKKPLEEALIKTDYRRR